MFHFVQVTIGNMSFKTQVSTQGCASVYDFKVAIKSKLSTFSNVLAHQDAGQLNLFQSDGISEIDPETPVTELKEVPGNPMVVTLKQAPAVRLFVKLVLKNKTFTTQVSTEGCTYFLDFRIAIKNKFSSELDPYPPYLLTLFESDGMTEICPFTLVADLNTAPMNPMVVKVQDVPNQAHNSTSSVRSSRKVKKQLKLTVKKASYKRLLDTIALEFSLEYNFPTTHERPSMADVLAAKNGQYGEPENPTPGLAWWDYLVQDGFQYTITPLPDRFSPEQWCLLRYFNSYVYSRMHNSHLPRTSTAQPSVVIPPSRQSLKALKKVIIETFGETDFELLMNFSRSPGSTSLSAGEDEPF